MYLIDTNIVIGAFNHRPRDIFESYDESEDMIVEDVEFGERKFKTDQGDYFNFKIPLVSSVQSALDVKPEAVSEAEEGMSEQVDTYIGKLMKDGVKNSNKVGTLPLDIEKKDAYKTLVALRKKLNATSVPKTDRFVMVGPEMESALLYDERLDKAVNNSNLLNGEIGRLLGFRIISAPTVPTVAGREVSLWATRWLPRSATRSRRWRNRPCCRSVSPVRLRASRCTAVPCSARRCWRRLNRMWWSRPRRVLPSRR